MTARTATFIPILILLSVQLAKVQPVKGQSTRTVIVHPGYSGEKISDQWRNAIEDRMTRSQLDSMMALRRSLTMDETGWRNLIESKAAGWNRFRDSLAAPFPNAQLDDTVYVMVGYLGADDGFTFRYNAVCLDLTALNREYGSPAIPENQARIDRIFAHEFTHLLHKDWARRNSCTMKSFKDSILWECLYEGIGMYRSLSLKWFPVDGVLPKISRKALDELYPTFVDRITTIVTGGPFTDEEKGRLNADLSRGPVSKKWGALPVGLWLALEAGGKDENLIPWIDGGPESVIRLAKKYLTGEPRIRFLKTFPD